MKKVILWAVIFIYAVIFIFVTGHFILYPHYSEQQRYPWIPSCLIAVRQELNKNYSEIYRETENDIRQCENEILDEQKNYPVRPFVFGATKEKRELIKRYAAAARIYARKIKEGDLETLILLDWATPNTDRDEYTKLYFKHYGVIDLSDGQFPVKLFNNSQVPLPAKHHPAIHWLNEDSIIYGIDVGKNTSEPSYEEQIISVNMNTLEINKNHSEDDLSNAPYYRYQITYDWKIKGQLNGCLKLLDNDGHVCQPIQRSSHPGTGIDATTFELSRYDGTRKRILSFSKPKSLEMYFDPFSNTYWVDLDNKVWRFDRSFEKMSEENYATDLFTHNLDCPYGCDFLKFSTKYGFIVSRPLSIFDGVNGHGKVFEIGGLFLLTKDGKVMRIYKAPYLGPFAVSPSGCKVAFVQRNSGAAEETQGQIGLIDVCGYFSNETQH